MDQIPTVVVDPMPASLLKHDDYVVLNRPYAVRKGDGEGRSEGEGVLGRMWEVRWIAGASGTYSLVGADWRPLNFPSDTYSCPSLIPTPQFVTWVKTAQIPERYVLMSLPHPPPQFVTWVKTAQIPERYVLMSEPDHILLRPLPNFMRGDR